MAKSKAELLKEAKKLKLEVTEKNTVAEIQAAIKTANSLQVTVDSDAKTKKIAEPETINQKPKTETAKAGLPTEALAKAGKRSEKGLKEAEEKQAKTERQAKSSEASAGEEEKPKKVIKPARPRAERRGKKYKESAKLIDKSKQYNLSEALDLAVKTSKTKFDATVEIHFRLNVDPKQADQNIRDSVVLPAGTGKTVRVAVYSDDENVKKAKTAGADVAGNEDFLAQLDKEVLDFDILISTPNMMQKLAKYARVLGPKGLMPNPKSGTVTTDVVKAVEQAKAGKIEYRVDSAGIIHVGVGKVSFGAKKLETNASAIVASIKQNRSSGIKGAYAKSIAVTTTMGPPIKVLNSEL